MFIFTFSILLAFYAVTRYDKNNKLVGSFTNFTVTIDEKNANGVTKFTVSSTLEKASDDYFIIRFKSKKTHSLV
jgi:hypothetical protein